jgi:hypothetical protein
MTKFIAKFPYIIVLREAFTGPDDANNLADEPKFE